MPNSIAFPIAVNQMKGLTFVGLGLFDVKDISVKGLDAVRNADFVFAEFYTSKLQGSTIEEMEIFFQRQIKILSREGVEEETILLDSAAKGDIILLFHRNQSCHGVR